MKRAIALTANCPSLPFGALIVGAETGDVVAEGWNKSAVNPTWHGERRSPGWACTIIGGVLEQECNALFDATRAAVGEPGD